MLEIFLYLQGKAICEGDFWSEKVPEWMIKDRQNDGQNDSNQSRSRLAKHHLAPVCVRTYFWLSAESKSRALGYRAPGVRSRAYSRLVPAGFCDWTGTGAIANLTSTQCFLKMEKKSSRGSSFGSRALCWVWHVLLMFMWVSVFHHVPKKLQ